MPNDRDPGMDRKITRRDFGANNVRSFPVVVFLLAAISGMHGCGEDEGSSPSASNTEITTSQSTGVADAQAGLPGAVSRERALNASDDVENWLLHGRTYNEQRFSPLEQITRRNIKRLGVGLGS